MGEKVWKNGTIVGDSVIIFSVGDEVGDAVGYEVGDAVGDEVGDAVGDEVGDVVGDEVGDSVRDVVGDEDDIVGENVLKAGTIDGDSVIPFVFTIKENPIIDEMIDLYCIFSFDISIYYKSIFFYVKFQKQM